MNNNKKYYIFTPSPGIVNFSPIVILILELLIFGWVQIDPTFVVMSHKDSFYLIKYIRNM